MAAAARKNSAALRRAGPTTRMVVVLPGAGDRDGRNAKRTLLAGTEKAVGGNTHASGVHPSKGRIYYDFATASFREPKNGETPLSDAEKLHAIKHRIAWAEDDEIDRHPMIRRWRPAGSWGITTPGLRRATPFDGLLA